MTIDTEISQYVIENSYSDLPPETVQRAKEFILDTIAIGIAAQQIEFVEMMNQTATRLQGIGLSSHSNVIWGIEYGGSPEYAAFLNATAAHSLEVDDTHSEAIVHPGAPIIPATLAKAEMEGAGGKSVLAGIVLGYEVACRLGLSFPADRHRELGFHPTATCGLFGATAGAGKVSSVDTETLVNAFGINTSQLAGVLQWKANAAWNKRIHPGQAARNGILSMTLAEANFRGAADPFTGKFGVLSVYGNDPIPEKLIDGLGETYEINLTGIKPYACCRLNHTIIDATLELVEEHNIQPGDVDSVTIESSDPVVVLSTPLERKQRPDSVVSAQFSPQYAVAVAITDRAALVDQFRPERFSDPEVLSLSSNVSVVEDPEMTARFPAEWPARVIIETNGQTFSNERSVPTGDPDHRLSWEDLIEKFTTITAPVIDTTQQTQIIECIDTLESVNDISAFTMLLQNQ